MTMAVTIPSSQGQAGADLKHPPHVTPKESLSAGCRQSRRSHRDMLGAGGPGPAMSSHLGTPPYVLYPGAAKYGDYYWFSAGSMDSAPTEEAPAPDALPLPAAKTPSPSGKAAGAMGLPRAGSGRVCGAGRCCGREPGRQRGRSARTGRAKGRTGAHRLCCREVT